MNNFNVDIVTCLQLGDSGKGCVSNRFLELYKYKNVCKVNGGGNAGHSVYHNNQKYVLHYLNSGVFDKNANIIIGPGCVIHIKKFLDEVEEFDKIFDIKKRLFVSYNTHIVTEECLEQDSKDSKIGTTKQGIGPTYAQKCLRIGIRAENIPELNQYIFYPSTLLNQQDKFIGDILVEMSQGFYLDVDHGNYPYVTSSNCLPQHFFTTFGIPMKYCRDIIGVAKWYETYSGFADNIVRASKEDEEIIREIGEEYGCTTGRSRRIGYLDIGKLIYAVKCTGTNVLIMKKMDILEKVNIFKMYSEKNLYVYVTSEDFKNNFLDLIRKEFSANDLKIIFSNRADGKDIL